MIHRIQLTLPEWLGDDIIDQSVLNQLRDIIQSGGVIASPSDSVYGLLANATSDDAIQAVYDLKGRPKDNPIHVFVGSVGQAKKLTQMTRQMQYAVRAILPGPLTIVLPKRPEVSDLLTAGGDTLGIRIPDVPFLILLPKIFQLPLTATSANLSGENPVTTADDAEQLLRDRLPEATDAAVIDVPEWRPPNSKPSTVLEIHNDNTITIHRPGAVSTTELQQRLGDNFIINTPNE